MMFKAKRVIFSAILCLLTVFSMSACQKKPENTADSTAQAVSGNVTVTQSAMTDQSEPKDPGSDTETDDVGGRVVYTSANDEVTAKIEVNLRESATTNSDTVGVLKNGTFLKRTGIASNGWSRLEYNGGVAYAVTSYLTTDKNYRPPESETEPEDDGFVPASGTVTAKELTNLRSGPSEKSELIASIKNGELAERVAVSPRGWTRLLYKGKTVYAKSSLLTTDLSGNSPSVSTDNFTPASGKVTAKLSETNLRTGPSTVGTEVVYTLKKGEFADVTGERNGWTRISHNGQTVYAISSYLITEEEYNAEQAKEP